MITFEFDIPCKYQAKFYHEWDVDSVVEWEDITKEDIGKYVKFDDGSRWYAKILDATTRIIVTSAGLYRRAGLVHVALPLSPNTSTFGLYANDVHPLVRQYTNRERAVAHKFLAGETTTSVSRRVRMLAAEEVQRELEQSGVNRSWFARRLYEEANMKGGKNFQFAMGAIAKLNGMDVTTPLDKLGISGGGLLSGHLGRELPNNDSNKLLKATANITQMVKKAHASEEIYVSVEDVDGSESDAGDGSRES